MFPGFKKIFFIPYKTLIWTEEHNFLKSCWIMCSNVIIIVPCTYCSFTMILLRMCRSKEEEEAWLATRQPYVILLQWSCCACAGARRRRRRGWPPGSPTSSWMWAGRSSPSLGTCHAIVMKSYFWAPKHHARILSVQTNFLQIVMPPSWNPIFGHDCVMQMFSVKNADQYIARKMRNWS